MSFQTHGKQTSGRPANINHPEIEVRTSYSIIDKEIVDEVAELMERHKVMEAIFLWVAVSLLNFWIEFPVEWVFFLYFTIFMLSYAYKLGAAIATCFTLCILAVDVFVFIVIPYKLTSITSNIIVYTFLLYGSHDSGLSLQPSNMGGLLLILFMTFLRHSMWSLSFQYPNFMSPISAHCTGFGICYITWNSVVSFYHHFEAMSQVLGIILPEPPSIIVRDVSETHFKLEWTLNSTTFLKHAGSEIDGEDPDTHDVSISKQQQQVLKYSIELNGIIVGDASKDDTCMMITGLNSGTIYRVRIWAYIGSKFSKVPSKSILVKTSLPATDSEEVGNDTKESFLKASILTAKLLSVCKETLLHNYQPTQSKCLSSKPTPAISEPLSSRENAALELKITTLTAEIDQTRQTIEALTKIHSEAQSQLLIHETDTKQELLKLRDEKRISELPRLELKAKLKAMEDMKRDLESEKAKLEKQLGQDKQWIEAHQKILQTHISDIDSIYEQMRIAQVVREEASKISEKEKNDMESLIASKSLELVTVEQELSEKQTYLSKLEKQLFDERKANKSNKDSASQVLLQKEDRYRLELHVLKEEQSKLLATHHELQLESQKLHDDLDELSRIKMQLLQQLNILRRQSKTKMPDENFLHQTTQARQNAQPHQGYSTHEKYFWDMNPESKKFASPINNPTSQKLSHFNFSTDYYGKKGDAILGRSL